jgi:hypothetical protein
MPTLIISILYPLLAATLVGLTLAHYYITHCVFSDALFCYEPLTALFPTG